jgi:hypothetical protein
MIFPVLSEQLYKSQRPAVFSVLYLKYATKFRVGLIEFPSTGLGELDYLF